VNDDIVDMIFEHVEIIQVGKIPENE